MYNQEKAKNKFIWKEKVQKTVKNPQKTKNNKKHKVTVYMFFPDEMRSELPICCCGFRLIYIIADKKIEWFGGGLGTLPWVLFQYLSTLMVILPVTGR